MKNVLVFLLLAITPCFAAEVNGVVRNNVSTGSNIVMYGPTVMNTSVILYKPEARVCISATTQYTADNLPYTCLHQFFIQSTVSGPDGNFSFANVPAGDYYVLAACRLQDSCQPAGWWWDKSTNLNVREPSTRFEVKFGE